MTTAGKVSDTFKSPSTRRAWIEMARKGRQMDDLILVALHPEGVDRNLAHPAARCACWSRPPPGGRG